MGRKLGGRSIGEARDEAHDAPTQPGEKLSGWRRKRVAGTHRAKLDKSIKTPPRARVAAILRRFVYAVRRKAPAAELSLLFAASASCIFIIPLFPKSVVYGPCVRRSQAYTVSHSSHELRSESRKRSKERSHGNNGPD
ncbi:hypothetical protein MRX96_006500 [Rhipicephalus microplus]